MSIELSHQNTGSPSTPTPTIVNGTPSTPVTTMVVVPEAPIITMDRPIVNDQYITSSPFGSLGHSPGYCWRYGYNIRLTQMVKVVIDGNRLVMEHAQEMLEHRS